MAVARTNKQIRKVVAGKITWRLIGSKSLFQSSRFKFPVLVLGGMRKFDEILSILFFFPRDREILLLLREGGERERERRSGVARATHAGMPLPVGRRGEHEGGCCCHPPPVWRGFHPVHHHHQRPARRERWTCRRSARARRGELTPSHAPIPLMQHARSYLLRPGGLPLLWRSARCMRE
jgi:hypothetical protein